MDLPALVEKMWPYALVAAPGILAAWKAWATQRSDLVKIAQDAAGAVIEQLRKEADRLAARLKQVEDELASLRREHAQMIAQKDAQIALLEGEKRQLTAKVEALQRVLAAHGWGEPKTFDALEIDHDGRLKTMGGEQ